MIAPTREQELEGICRVMTASLKRNACFHWGEIRRVLGEEAYARMQRQRGLDRVWLVDRGGTAPDVGGTILSHLDVSYAGARDTGPNRHAAIRTSSAASLGGQASDVIHLGVSNHEQWHRVGQDEINTAQPELVENIVRSFHGGTAANAEKAVYDTLLAIPGKELALGDGGHNSTGPSRRGTDYANILEAGAKIARDNPDVAFPQGIVAMVSPKQARRMLEDGVTDAGEGAACRIDVVASPAVRHDTARGGHIGIVVAKKGVRVKLGAMEMCAFRDDSGIGVRAQYSTHVEANPKMVARVFLRHGQSGTARKEDGT